MHNINRVMLLLSHTILFRCMRTWLTFSLDPKIFSTKGMKWCKIPQTSWVLGVSAADFAGGIHRNCCKENVRASCVTTGENVVVGHRRSQQVALSRRRSLLLEPWSFVRCRCCWSNQSRRSPMFERDAGGGGMTPWLCVAANWSCCHHCYKKKGVGFSSFLFVLFPFFLFFFY